MFQAPSLFVTLPHTKYDWDYIGYLDKDVGQAHRNGVIALTRGKMLGGTSSINYEVYMRGKPGDYDDWNKIAPGWNWNNVLHYFKKLEGMTDPTVFHDPKNAYLHSKKGPVLITKPQSLQNPQSNSYFIKQDEIYLNALQEIGIQKVLENNGPEIVGGSTLHYNIANGRRFSTAEAYLIPNKDRTNLYITKYARAIKVLIDPNENRAYGVKVLLKNGKTIKVYAKKEVIVSAGSVDTPKLLMLSGIGPREELEKFHIDTIADLPVGKNLQEHQVVLIVYTGERGLQTAVQNLLTIKELDTFPLPNQCAFFTLNNTGYCYKSKPQFQLFNFHLAAGSSPLLKIFCTDELNFNDQYCSSLARVNDDRELDITTLVLLHPESRGQVTLQSQNPYDDPIIKYGFYSDRRDENTMVEGLKYLTRLVKTSHYRKVGGTIPKLNVTGCEGLQWGTDKYWHCYARNAVTSFLHLVGTCSMGPHGVVDEKLRVHGVKNLRVVDASIMPLIPSANTNVPTMMIGERASDLIKMDHLNRFHYTRD